MRYVVAVYIHSRVLMARIIHPGPHLRQKTEYERIEATLHDVGPMNVRDALCDSPDDDYIRLVVSTFTREVNL